jgi:Ca-activated chloride channel family protein
MRAQKISGGATLRHRSSSGWSTQRDDIPHRSESANPSHPRVGHPIPHIWYRSMPIRDLKTKPVEFIGGPLLLPENPRQEDPDFIFPPDQRPLGGGRPFLAAVFLSLLLHLLILLLFRMPSSASDIMPVSSLVCDTRALDTGPPVDCIITLPDTQPSPQVLVENPITTPVEKLPLQPPVIVADRRPQTGYSTPPLVPRFTQEPAPEKTGVDSPSEGTGSSGHQGTERPRIAFFRTHAAGQTIVYVIDRSASMGLNGGLAFAKRELQSSLDRLPPATRFQVIAYNRFAEPLRVGGKISLLAADWDNKNEVLRAIEGWKAEGGTDHLGALQRALVYQPDIIFFLTDADDLTDALIQNVTNLNRGRTAIHTFEFKAYKGNGAKTPLQILAEKNRGAYRAVYLPR